MKFRVLYIICMVWCLSVAACMDCAEPEPKDWDITSGAVYIGCHPGPYAFMLDSLKVYCGGLGPFDFQTTADSIVSDCTYDELHDVLGGTNPEITLTRAAQGVEFTWEIQIPGADIEEVPIELNGVMYQEGEYPYLGGRQVRLPQSEVDLYMVNRYVGGCFHDILIWEIRELE